MDEKTRELQTVGERMIEGGETIKRTQTEYQTAIAVQKPRDLARVITNSLIEARRAGSNFYYAWDIQTDRGKKHIEGGSIGLATCLARNYGNCAIPVKVETIDENWVFTACFVDFETGYNYSRTFVMPKTSKTKGKYSAERSQIMAFQKAQSQAIRNVILNGGVPKWLVAEAIIEAKEGEMEAIKGMGIKKAQEKIVDFFSGHSVSKEDLIAFVGKPFIEWKADDIAKLRGVAQSITDGIVTPQEAFSGPTGKAPIKQPQAKDPAPETDTKSIYKEMLDQFKMAKESIGDKKYYQILSIYKFKHSNEIKSVKQGEEILNEMAEKV